MESRTGGRSSGGKVVQPELARGPIAGGDEAAELGISIANRLRSLRLVGNRDQHLACRAAGVFQRASIAANFAG